MTAATSANPAKTSEGVDAGVEILSKPKPEYSAEARELRIEGDVVIEVLFPAAGRARGLRIVSGLGHGLDEKALAAIDGIRYRPASRAGSAIDSKVTIRVVFQLAY